MTDKQTASETQTRSERLQRLDDFFSFDKDGRFTWWAGAILGTLAALTLSAIIIVSVRSGQRVPPPALLQVKDTYCPFFSPLNPTNAPYTAWLDTCRTVQPGQVYPCMSDVSCLLLGTSCASPVLLQSFSCAYVPEVSGATGGRPVCVLSNTAISPPVPSGGGGAFCGKPNTKCALCVGAQCSDAPVINCVPARTCTDEGGTSVVNDTWRCLT